MQRRICPICDHPIQHGHYCSFCKQWIRHPNYVNATYYLNERHPAHETDCEYHNAGAGSWEQSIKTGADAVRTLAERAKTYSQTQKASGAGRQPGRPAPAQAQNRGNTGRQPVQKRAAVSSAGKDSGKGKSKKNPALLIFMIFCIIYGISYLFRFFMYILWLL